MTELAMVTFLYVVQKNKKFCVKNFSPLFVFIEKMNVLQDVLSPLDVSGKGHVDRSLMVRIYCRVKPPGWYRVLEEVDVKLAMARCIFNI